LTLSGGGPNKRIERMASATLVPKRVTTAHAHHVRRDDSGDYRSPQKGLPQMTGPDFYPGYHRGVLRPESAAILQQLAGGDFPALDTVTPADARAAFVLPEWLDECDPNVRIEEATAGEVPVRIYRPMGAACLPVMVFFHGGGFVAGDLDDFEPFCTFLSARVRCVVVSVGYRRSPESPFPAALDDAWAATLWAASEAPTFGGDPTRLAVAGDSAGANLAAGVTALARDHDGPGIGHQILISPWVDLTTAAEDTESFAFFGEGLWLSSAAIGWYRGHYLKDLAMAKDPLVSPLLAAEVRALPPALVLTAEFDVLADQGRAYAARLQDAGVAVVHRRYDGMLHDFVTLPGLFPSAWEAIDDVAAFSREAFKRS